MQLSLLRTVSIFMLLISLSDSYARVLCPRVTSEHTADLSDWQRFRNFHQWKDKSGQDLALEVWQYLCDYETGVYHFNEIFEGDDPFSEYATVRDPQKILNIYNMGYCGIFGPVLDGVFQNIGFEQGRAFGVDLWSHCATELWYDDEWHYYDLDVRGALLDETGNVASLDAAKTVRELWTNPPVAIKPFFPKDPDKNKVYEIYRDSPVNYYYRWFEGSHTMDFYLRQGESFTRWWNPQGGRWHHHPLYNKTSWVKELLQTEPLGMKPNHREFTRWNHGNGLLEYAPNLTGQSSDFDDGNYSASNLIPGKEGLNFINDGHAEVVFEVFTPYIIVAKVNDMDDFDDDTEASQINLFSNVDVQLSLSLNQGKTWEPVCTVEKGLHQIIDVTQWVNGTHGYLVKLSMNGSADETAIRSMKIETWVQVAPIGLPRLKKGVNHLQYDLGDRYGLETEPVLVNPNLADPDDVMQYFTKKPDDYDPKRNTSRMIGEGIMHLQSYDGKPIKWFSVGAAFRTHQGEYAAQTKNSIAYAVGEPKQFYEIHNASVPTWVNHWRYNWDGDVQLQQPADDVYIRFVGDPGLNTVRACLHTLPKQPTTQMMEITHGFSINNELHTITKQMDQPQKYTIECEDKPENAFIRMSVPSQIK